MVPDKEQEKQYSEAREQEDENRRPGMLQILQSTLAAAFGVQTQKARERDFNHGRPLPYIIAGVIFTIVFIITLVVIVNVVLRSAGV